MVNGGPIMKNIIIKNIIITAIRISGIVFIFIIVYGLMKLLFWLLTQIK